jgi:hypothetical protein
VVIDQRAWLHGECGGRDGLWWQWMLRLVLVLVLLLELLIPRGRQEIIRALYAWPHCQTTRISGRARLTMSIEPEGALPHEGRRRHRCDRTLERFVVGRLRPRFLIRRLAVVKSTPRKGT